MTLIQNHNLSQIYGVDQLPKLVKFLEEMNNQYMSMKDVLFTNLSVQNTDIWQVSTASGIRGPQAIPYGTTPNFDTIKQGFATTVTFTKYGAGFAIYKEAIADQNKLNLVDRAMKFFGIGAAEKKEYNLAGVFDDAFTTALADGKVLCATDHPLEGVPGGVNSNLGTAAAFSKTSLRALRNVLQNQVDEQGNKVNPKAAYLVIPQELQDDVQEVLGSEYDPDNANNTRNTLFGFTNLLPGNYWPYMSSSTSYFLIQPKEHTHLYYIQRDPFKVNYEYESIPGIHQYASEERYAISAASHRGVCGNFGA